MTQRTPYAAEELDMEKKPGLRLSDEDDDLEDEQDDDDHDDDDDDDDDLDDDGPDFGPGWQDPTELDDDGLYPDGSRDDEPGPGMG